MRNKIYYYSVIIFLALFSRMFSQSAQDLQKMKSEYERLQKGQSNIQQSPSSQLNVGIDTGIPSQAILSTYPFEAMDSVEIGLKHFGYDFFTLRDTVKFWENLPATANYLLGPGDELIVTLWGETQVRETYTISREGKIYNDKVGLMNMGGKTIGQSKKYLMDQFSRVYATLKGERPSTFMDVSLGKLRSINVNFVGEVKFPGVYPIHSFSTVITGLIQAGGIDTTGSLRNIRILRDGKKFTDIDLYSYLLKGNVPNQIQLRDQDVVVVPVRLSRVEIDSAVVRPGIYESISGETIRQMIDNAGGLTPFASSIIGLERITPIQNRKKDEIDYKNYYIDF